MKRLITLITFCLIALVGYCQDETERIFLYKSNGEYFVRVEIPYYTDLSTPDNKIIVEVPGKVRHEATLTDMRMHQSQNEFTDYVAVYDFPLGKDKLFRFKKLNCKVTFDYEEMEEVFSLEFRKFMWL